MGGDVRQQRAQSGPLYLDIVSREHEPQFIVAACGIEELAPRENIARLV
jgi:hypothetical protein